MQFIASPSSEPEDLEETPANSRQHPRASTSVFYQYRLPRFVLHRPLELLVSGHLLRGLCLNLSETGLLAQLEYPPALPDGGTVRLILPPWTIDLKVEVAYTDGCRSGLRFVFGSNQQRQFIRAIVQGTR